MLPDSLIHATDICGVCSEKGWTGDITGNILLRCLTKEQDSQQGETVRGEVSRLQNG